MTQEAPKELFSNERVEAALAEFRRGLATISLSDWKKETLLTAMEDAARSSALPESEERTFCGKALAEFEFDREAPPTNCFEQTLCELSFELRETRLDAVAPSLRELRRRWSENGESGESGESGENGESGGGLFGGDIDESENGGASRWGNGDNKNGGGAPSGQNLAEPREGDRVRIIVELATGATASADYVVDATVGRGGQKRVFSLRQEGTGRRLALKQALKSGRATRRAFAQEAKAQGLLEHPNIPTLFWADALQNGDPNEPPILIESFVPGEPWSARAFDLKSRDENLAILLKIATIMTYVHREAGVVHRDLKPANAMLGKYDEIYLCDWGLALLAGKDEGASRSGGTLAYAAPEQLRGETVDFRADVYALGAILYKILTGVAPHEATGKYSLKALFERAKQGAFDMLAPDAGPAELRIVALKALSRDPADRYADAGEFAEALTTYLRRSKIWERFEKLTFRLACLREEFGTAESLLKTKEKRDVWAVRLNTSAAFLNELTTLRKETDDTPTKDASERELRLTLLDAEINARIFLLDKTIQLKDFATATALAKEQLSAVKRRFDLSGDTATYNKDARIYQRQRNEIQEGVDNLTSASKYQVLFYVLIPVLVLSLMFWIFAAFVKEERTTSYGSSNNRVVTPYVSTDYKTPPIVYRDFDLAESSAKKKEAESRLAETEDWQATLGMLLAISRLEKKLDESELNLLEREADLNVANETIRKLRQQLAETEAAASPFESDEAEAADAASPFDVDEAETADALPFDVDETETAADALPFDVDETEAAADAAPTP